ncbi:hypothetical protein SAMN06296386_101346 [Lachnospiraceae bacterium]|nr:hypothetical protein SAMN06296386_101346 [Lachnospiraceae bacterium]
MLGKRRYIFTSSSQSSKGIMSSVLGLISLISFIAVMMNVLKAGGSVGPRQGAVGFVSCLFSVAGTVLGVMSLIEPDKFRLFPRLGFTVSLLSLIAWGGIIYAGIAGI